MLPYSTGMARLALVLQCERQLDLLHNRRCITMRSVQERMQVIGQDNPCDNAEPRSAPRFPNGLHQQARIFVQAGQTVCRHTGDEAVLFLSEITDQFGHEWNMGEGGDRGCQSILGK